MRATRDAADPPGVTNVNFDDAKYKKHIKDRKHENNINLKRFFAALGLCHTVICDTKKDKKTGKEYIQYNASSPDELALVNGAGAVRISRFERGLDLRVLLRMDLARRPARTGDFVVSG